MMLEKMTNLAMLATAAAWLAWIVIGGNGGDYDMTVSGTYLAAGIMAAAYSVKLIGRTVHGNH